MNNQKPIKTSFWDFKTPKVYTNAGEMILDFLVGLFVADLPIRFLGMKLASLKFEMLRAIDGQVYSISDRLPFLVPFFIVIILLILAVFYFWKRRRHLACGLLISLIFAILSFTLAV